MIQPNGPRLLVRNVLCSMTAGGLHIPDRVQDRRKVVRAEVIAVGGGVHVVDPFGRVRDRLAVCEGDRAEFEPGMIVHFMAGSGVEVEYDGEAYLVVKTEEILASEPEPRPTAVFVDERQLEPIDLPQIGPESFE